MLTFSKCFTVAEERQQKKQGTQEVCAADNTSNTLGVHWVHGEQQGGQQGRPGGQVEPPALAGEVQAPEEHGEDVHQQDGDAAVQQDVDRVEAGRVEASRQVVVHPEGQHGERPVGLVAGVAAQPAAPEVMTPQVPEGRFCSEVLIVNNRFRVVEDKVAIVAACETQEGSEAHD